VATQLLLNRPDVKQAEQELLAAKLDVKAARAAFFPSIELGASYGREAFKQQLLAHTPESMFFKLAADLFSPVVNLNEIKANMRIANAKQEQAFLEYERVSLQSYLEVSSQLWRLENLQEQLRLQEDQAAALKEANRISGVLFTSARADYLEVLLTQRESLEAQNQWLESQKDLIDANINLYKSLGGGWF
jgi:outer membrane protein TolC